MLNTNWVFRKTENSDSADLFKLIKTLDEQASEKLYSTEFVVTLIEEFWQLYQMSIFVIVFIPFLIIPSIMEEVILDYYTND